MYATRTNNEYIKKRNMGGRVCPLRVENENREDNRSNIRKKKKRIREMGIKRVKSVQVGETKAK